MSIYPWRQTTGQDTPYYGGPDELIDPNSGTNPATGGGGTGVRLPPAGPILPIGPGMPTQGDGTLPPPAPPAGTEGYSKLPQGMATTTHYKPAPEPPGGGEIPTRRKPGDAGGFGNDWYREFGGQMVLPGLAGIEPPPPAAGSTGGASGAAAEYSAPPSPDYNPLALSSIQDGVQRTPSAYADLASVTPSDASGTTNNQPPSPLQSYPKPSIFDETSTKSFDLPSYGTAPGAPGGPQTGGNMLGLDSLYGTPPSTPGTKKPTGYATPAAPTMTTGTEYGSTPNPYASLGTPYGAAPASGSFPAAPPRNQQDLFDKWRQTWGQQVAPVGVSPWDYAPTYFMPQTGRMPAPFQQQNYAMTNAYSTYGPR